MLLRMVYDDNLAQAAYLVGCQSTGEAVLFDPQRDVDRYLRLASELGLRIVGVAETHIHADFVSGARELAERGVKVYLSDEGGADWTYRWVNQRQGAGSYDVRLLKDGDTFGMGGVEFRAMHTPGHTPEHMCYMVTDKGAGAAEPVGMISGDFMFVGDLGRPDLLETAASIEGSAESSARELFRSLGRLERLAEYMQVWPGHGAGSACGKALGAVPQTTLGYERRHSRALREAVSEPSFMRFILDGQPEPPLYFARMKRVNRDGPALLGEVPSPGRLGAGALLSLDTRRAALVDTRVWDEFRRGHVPGALHLPLIKAFPTDAGSMIEADEAVYLIADGRRVDEAVRYLVRVGIDRIAGWFEPSVMEEFVRLGGPIAQTREIDVQEAARAVGQEHAFLLDVRGAGEFAQSRIAGSKCIAHTRLLSRMGDVPRDRPLLVSCRSGQRSARASALLERHGFQAANVRGGILAWTQAGLPVEP